MTNLGWGYLGLGYIIAVIFAAFFTKMVVIRPLYGGKLTINCRKSVMYLPLSLPWVHVIVILANIDDEIILDGLDVVFSIKHGGLLLMSGLIWPVSLSVLLLEAYVRISGKPLDINTTINFEK
ncbi:MAG: hypothetical protein UV48_C0028G0002 [Candidatus Azambacteria bacterium GW2011_GWA2_42_9]|uniref:Uncharacterized protein n=2 Tax=Candidatus Azamiibacteriota TaxID=1752741 RepID=A0A0G1C215_9BACT|nr:MAG: hypothetical protein UV07_C0027G0002 [Candidatus Azambacteria bacterium GW2011_GWB1_42_17]KKS74767.1 MAG: hypothetical protein UV48_C0028G0002 [Candidatus Azambacteria bacterium GW2011_GWA2_42_9]